MTASITISFEDTDQGTVIMGVLKQPGSDEIIYSPKYIIKSGYDSESNLVEQAKQILEVVMSDERNSSDDADKLETYCSEFREQVSAAADHILQTYVPEQDVAYIDCGDKDIAEAARVDGYGDDTKITVYDRSADFPLIRACAVYLLRKYLPQIPEGVPNSTDISINDDFAYVARGDLIYALSRALMVYSGISKDVYTSIMYTDTETITDELWGPREGDLKSNN